MLLQNKDLNILKFGFTHLPDSYIFLNKLILNFRNQLLEQLKLHTAFKAEPQSADYDLGKLGGALVKGAELLSKGIATGADKAGGLIEYYTDKTQQSMEKAESDAKVCRLFLFDCLKITFFVNGLKENIIIN